MDPYLTPWPERNAPDGSTPMPYWDMMRKSMGYTLAFAQRLNLAKMTPRDDLASSGYCLADPGLQYLVYLPAGGKVAVDLTALSREAAAEWFDPQGGEIAETNTVTGGKQQAFDAPFKGDAVLHICRKD